MSAKRYVVEAQRQRSGIWEPIYYTDDLDGAKRYAAAMLKSQEIRVTRVVAQRAGEAVGGPLCANISETTLPWKLEYNREGGGGQNVSRQSGRGCDT